ncbi:NAD-dependent epimerase/dehydratase family protein [Marinimicrobium agarilyticum]|uniref:NAD-dependent epimerase/dehydratase family protein n=1 Tax=Marinimicrobium agarilyticum TaxID=306546 RepID=UPI0003F51798|nr:NAD-dependent epimerase/dehydratase family protein [Marinimicrobium agarilyticum]
MKVLFIGGTGQISTAVSQLLVDEGVELYLLNRGNRNDCAPDGARVLKGDINNRSEIKSLLKDRYFDVVVNWIAFHPDDIERDIEYFTGKTDQYIFISTVATYQRPPAYYVLDESTPQYNPVWDYATDKIACEQTLLAAFRTHGFPATIVRPSQTYGDGSIPFAVNSATHPWTLVDRIARGKKVIVPGDGSSLWCVTHNTDFAKGFIGLLGHSQTRGHAFHITSDEVKTWDQYLAELGSAVGVKAKPIHMTTECISRFLPEFEGPLRGDASNSFVLDNTKIKTFVPGYRATTRFEQGIRQSVAYYKRHPERQTIDEPLNARMDHAINAYERFLASL